MKKINNIFLFFCLVFAIVFFVSCDCEANKNEKKDVTSADVTNLTVKCVGSGKVKLTWTNPTDADFEKVIITYGTNGKVKVFTPNNETIITGLTNEKKYTFTVKTYNEAGNASNGIRVNCTPIVSNVTNLIAKCIASGTVKLSWTNSEDIDFTKVVITYETDGKVEVLKTATPNNEATITDLTNDVEYTFIVKSYDEENASSGVRVKCTPVLSNVTNLTVKCTASGTVKLAWTNPIDTVFSKFVITYETSKTLEVKVTDSPNNEAKIRGLTIGKEYTFTVKAYDEGGTPSSGVSINATPAYFGGLVGTPTGGQTQGAVLKDSLKETWMDSDGNIMINGIAIPKTSEVVAVPTGTVAVVSIPDDSSWSSYYSGSDSKYKGVFLKDRKVKLDPFVISQYLVTQKLYYEIIGKNPSHFSGQDNRPVECVSWREACVFCNELTKKIFGEDTDQCVYYADSELISPLSEKYSSYEMYIAYDTTEKKWSKKGYRLPTEAEWEFAARGGDPNAEDSNGNSIWNYMYAGVQAKIIPSDYTSGPYTDAQLNEYGWHRIYSTQEVGLKKCNTLNLYDMSGNVFEWCNDGYNENVCFNDDAFTTMDGYVQNPLGMLPIYGYCSVNRGGDYGSEASFCAVSYRIGDAHSNKATNLGIRLVRSTEVTE